jgi:diguanylate cyclase (GGDEF)-like protein/PAS domain S-box-containing protein
MPNYLFVPYFYVLFLTTLISIFVAVIAWRRRSAPGGMMLFLAMLGVAEWNFCAAFETAAVDPAVKITWSKILYLGSVSSSLLMLFFAVTYTHRRHWLKRWVIVSLTVLSIIHVLMAATNDWHHLIWTDFSPAAGNILIYHHGAWFWVYVATTYAFTSLATLLLIWTALRSKGIYRRQALAILFASIAPWVLSLSYVFNVTPFPGLDTSPVGYMMFGLILVWSFKGVKFLDLVPVARGVLIEKMLSGVVVVDTQDRLVDINPAALRILDLTKRPRPGQTANEILSPQLELPFFHSVTADRVVEMTLKQNPSRFVEIQITPLYETRARLSGYLIILRDITRRKQSEIEIRQANQRLQEQLLEIQNLQGELREQAMRDSLTGLYNRRHLDESLGRILSWAGRDAFPVVLMMVDIDHFKQVNDAYGHAAGDLLLKALSRLLDQQTRLEDIACRFGGEEFLLVFLEMDLQDSLPKAEKLRSAFEALRVYFQDIQLGATISIGIAGYPAHAVDASALIHAADMALYAAKSAGRNCIRVFEEI